MNSDSNVLMINGQSKFDDLDENEKKELAILANSLNKLIGNRENLEDIATVESINLLFNNTNQYIKNNNENDENTKINEIKNQILKIISPVKRFKFKKSSFCESLEKGDWVLIEQIESAPTEILEKLIPLTEVEPEIKIIQGAEEIIYKYKSNDKNVEKNNINYEENEKNNIIRSNSWKNDDIKKVKYISPKFSYFFYI